MKPVHRNYRPLYANLSFVSILDDFLESMVDIIG
jgi:hypothetical protein